MSQFDALDFTEVDVPDVLALQIDGQCPCDPAAIGAAMGPLFGRLMPTMQQHGLTPMGPPQSIYTAYGPDGIRFTVAMPVVSPPSQPIAEDAGRVGTVKGGKAMRFTHRGPYAGLMGTYGRIIEFLKARDLMQTEDDWMRYMPMWEEYLNDPQTTPETDLLTYIYLPVT